MRKRVLIGLMVLGVVLFVIVHVSVLAVVLVPFEDGCRYQGTQPGEPVGGWTRDLAPRGKWETVLGQDGFYVVEQSDRDYLFPTIAFPAPGGITIANSNRFAYWSSIVCQNFPAALRRSVRITFRVDKPIVYNPDDYGLPYELFAYR